MAVIDGMLQELEQEAQTTRRVLERVPDNQLGWRPHQKARTLGELALHVATVPGGVAELAARHRRPKRRSSVRSQPGERVGARSRARPEHRAGEAGARRMDDATLTATWRLSSGDRELLGDSAGGVPAVDHAQPLVSPPRAADGVPARARRCGSLDLRTERGRESVRCNRARRGGRARLCNRRIS